MFSLPALPYAENALEPLISAETMKTHHGKHHRKYVDTLNTLVAGTSFADMSLEELILKTGKSDAGDEKKIFNNAAQSWNHAFLWNSLTPEYDRAEDNPVLQAIDRDFGSFGDFKKAFVKEGVGHFGSGWVWLIAGSEKLEIMSTHDADLPLVHGKQALLTCDLWEHAYYLDYKNDRESFLGVFVDKLANWAFAASNLADGPLSRALEQTE